MDSRVGSNQNMEPQKGRAISQTDLGWANECFDIFLSASTLKTILGTYRNICELLHLKPNVLPHFYPKLKANLISWRAKALWKKFDLRANNKIYGKGKLCPNTRVLIIGAGPCGLRTAIEAQLLGAKVVVIEKRDRMSRNNVLHLWPFVIDDLRSLGAKKFFGKFCAGAIDHISIRQLQCILLKVALLLGVEVHTEVSFERLVEPNPNEKTGWRAEFKPSEHPVSQYEFDVIIGADGKRNTLQGFRRKEFRGKLAIAITANFINKRTEAEARVEEISGVAFIFNQKFFKDLYAETGIDLENIVYYKDDTHYFVMTAKKPSLIDKGVIRQDLPDTARLLAPDNVNRDELMNYAREAAEFSTNYYMMDLEFAVNHYGQPDVAMFDFTSMYAAENASKLIERHGYKLLTMLVGDSLLEPFWPTGSGCARGFLSSLDAGWAIRAYGSGMMGPLETIAERESIYRLLAQTTPENLNKDYKGYTLDPATRYPNLNRNIVSATQMFTLFDTDNPKSLEISKTSLPASTVLEAPKKRRRRESHVDKETLLTWIKDQVKEHEDLIVNDITTSLKDGRVLCAIISHYRPDLLDYSAITADQPAANNQLAFDILEKEIGIPPVMSGEGMANSEVPDYLAMLSYLTLIYDMFRCEIPHIKHPKLKESSHTKHPNSLNKGTNSKLRLPAPYKMQPTYNIDELDLTPVKSIEEFIQTTDESRVNSKSLVILKVNPSDLPNKNNNEKENEDSPRVLFSKSIYMLESKILQGRIDAAFKKRKAKKHSKRAVVKIMKLVDKVEVKDAAVGTNTIERYESQKLLSKICVCCSINKKNFISNQDMINEVNITISNKNTLQEVRLNDADNCVNITLPRTNPETPLKTKADQCRKRHESFEVNKFLSLANMSHSEATNYIQAEHTFDRVVNWITSSNFDIRNGSDSPKTSSVHLDGLTDITSVTRQFRKDNNSNEIVVEQLTDVVQFNSDGSNNVCKPSKEGKSASLESITQFLEELKNPERMAQRFSKLSHCPPNKLYERRIRSRSEPPGLFSIIVENEENELPEPKHAVAAFTKNHPAIKQVNVQPSSAAPVHAVHRPSSRHKRHAVEPPPALQKSASNERKPRKRKTMEKLSLTNVEDRMKRLEEIAQNRVDRQSKRRQQRKMQTDQFIKSMQMLQANCKPDHSEPFEDYSIFLYRQTAQNFEDRVKDLEKKFTYVPERENRVPSYNKGEKDEDFQARIKGMEEKWGESAITEKKPKDLLRAIGKIDNSDWNIKEIEKKIHENKLVKVNRDKERVPKWSREQFLARQTKMEKQHLEKQDSTEGKYAEIDKNIKQLDQKLKEGTVRDLKQKKVAMITEKFVPKADAEPKPVAKSNSKAVIIPTQGNSEICHFCSKRVYLMERLSAEGRFFHRGCFRCQYCHTALRLGSYLYDRDGKYGYRFYCSQHFGMQGELKVTKVTRKPSQRNKDGSNVSPEKKVLSGVAGVDLLDRVQTPERIEFANLSTGIASSDHDDSLSQMDEDEWTDRNFGASTAELGTSDEDSSSMSDTDSDDEDAFEEALDEPPTKEGTLKWAERFNKRYSKKRDDSESEDYSSSDQSSYYENSSGDDDSDTATEGEEEIRARELRKQEVRVEPPVVHTDTGTDTEVKPPSNTDTSNTPKDPLPDVLSNQLNVPNDRKGSKSSDDLSDFGSAESDLEALLREFESLEKSEKPENNNDSSDNKNLLAKSAVSPQPKVRRNFVLPPKENRKSFGKEFVPVFKPPSPEPILIIKRTPSKINLPKETKPKVALKPNLDSATKYFGDAVKKKPPVVRKPVLAKQASLPEKTKPPDNKKKEVKPAFNFDPLDDDIDDYIENLLQNEEELMKPIDPNKYKLENVEPEPPPPGDDEEKMSSSIEDLLKALETETTLPDGEDILDSEDKIEDLLNWMDDLDYQPTTPKVYRSYKNLERVLKSPERAETVVNKLPKDNIKYFERHLSGKLNPNEDNESFGLSRSKTDVFCNQARRSVDFDAISKVDIKKVLKKFESIDNDESKKEPPRPTRKFGKRNSFSNFSFKKDKDNNSPAFYESMCTVKSTVNPDFCKDLEINNNDFNDNLIADKEIGGGVVSAGLVLKAMRDLRNDENVSLKSILQNEGYNKFSDERLTDKDLTLQTENRQERKRDMSNNKSFGEKNEQIQADIGDMLYGCESAAKATKEEIQTSKRNVDDIVKKIADLQNQMNQRSKSPNPEASRMAIDGVGVTSTKIIDDVDGKPVEERKNISDQDNKVDFIDKTDDRNCKEEDSTLVTKNETKQAEDTNFINKEEIIDDQKLDVNVKSEAGKQSKINLKNDDGLSNEDLMSMIKTIESEFRNIHDEQKQQTETPTEDEYAPKVNYFGVVEIDSGYSRADEKIINAMITDLIGTSGVNQRHFGSSSKRKSSKSGVNMFKTKPIDDGSLKCVKSPKKPKGESGLQSDDVLAEFDRMTESLSADKILNLASDFEDLQPPTIVAPVRKKRANASTEKLEKGCENVEKVISNNCSEDVIKVKETKCDLGKVSPEDQKVTGVYDLDVTKSDLKTTIRSEEDDLNEEIKVTKCERSTAKVTNTEASDFNKNIDDKHPTIRSEKVKDIESNENKSDHSKESAEDMKTAEVKSDLIGNMTANKSDFVNSSTTNTMIKSEGVMDIEGRVDLEGAKSDLSNSSTGTQTIIRSEEVKDSEGRVDLKDSKVSAETTLIFVGSDFNEKIDLDKKSADIKTTINPEEEKETDFSGGIAEENAEMKESFNIKTAGEKDALYAKVNKESKITEAEQNNIEMDIKKTAENKSAVATKSSPTPPPKQKSLELDVIMTHQQETNDMRPPQSPPVPRRVRKSSEPPTRPARQKSLEQKRLTIPSFPPKIASDETSTESSSEVQNSATEISTDSEFAHDDPTPTREVPSIVFNDIYVTKTRGRYTPPQRVQVKTTETQKPLNSKTQSKDIELKFTPLVLTPIVRKPAPPLLLQTEGYALNRTQSTGGIATKVSLELKKKYLLGECSPANFIQKSGSASTLDSKLKSFHSTISDCQKLLKPAPEVSASMQTFCTTLNERTSPTSPLFFAQSISKIEEKKVEPENEKSEKKVEPVPFENENEGRPRSPVHETSIIVPQIDWSQQKPNTSDNSSETSSCSSSSESEIKDMPKSSSVKSFNNIPKLEVQDVDSKDTPIDSLNYAVNYSKLNESQPSSINEPPKSIASEKKTLNPPKPLPTLTDDSLLNQVHSVLHNKPKVEEERHSGRSTPSNNDPVTAVLTETELSDWAREGAVSDDLEDEFEPNQTKSRHHKKPKTLQKEKEEAKKAVITEMDELRHVCGKSPSEPVAECVNNILHPDLDNIEFMDTGTESSDDDVVEVKNNGYIQFHDEEDIVEDSLSPTININVNVVEATNPRIKATFDEDFDDLSTVSRNTGYCIIGAAENEKNTFGGEVIDLKPTDLEKLKEKRGQVENEEDSLLIIETGTTTEENTCSDSTVKNITQIIPSKEKEVVTVASAIIENNNTFDAKRLEDKLAQVKKDMKKLHEQRKAEQIVEQNLRNNIEFEQHCQRLQSKVDFGNAKDSIDIRKSRKQIKPGSPPKPDLIQEEKEVSPVQSRREQLEKERDLNKKLVQEMVMNKMKAQNKSLERKRRNRNSFSPSVSPCRPIELTKSTTSDMVSQLNNPTPDVLLSTMNIVPVQKSQTVGALSEFNKPPPCEPKIIPRSKYHPSLSKPIRPLSVHSSFLTGSNETGIKVAENNKVSSTEAFSLPDIQKALVMDQFQTPKVPPRLKNEEAKRVVEKLKEDARARARLLSDEDLGLSPEDKLARLRQRVNRRGKENDIDIHVQDSIESLVVNTERRNSLLYSNDTLKKKKNNSFRRSKSGEEYLNQANMQSDKDSRERTKSVSDINKHIPLTPRDSENKTRCFNKSDPNLLEADVVKREKKKPKDRERRKSITKLFTDLFTKKKDPVSVNNGNKGFLARISPKAKDKSKEIIKEEPVRRMSFTELRRSVPGNISPPPIPPLPLNYTGSKSIEDSSDGESDYKRIDRSSCDTLDQSGMQDGSVCSRRSGRLKRAARQSQLKRHRLAQEIQRKLEETEVKMRELELRGVRVEKALRGESDDGTKEETDLLKEWFDLMRDMTELKRYERELNVRAQELELEDRHARLQHDLKERLEIDGQKTREDIETEGSIIKEMMDIVRKRDSLISLLEEDRLRYSEEDKGFEEQMLAKGINLTPMLTKVTEK